MKKAWKGGCMMRIRDLFTVPEGQKVTEKHLRRVLISSVCSILLCMSCLVGTTWAWFTVSIENTDNVIQIGTPEVRLTIGGEEHNPEESLVAADYTVKIEHANVGDAFQKKADLYVTMTIQSENGTITVYTVLNSDNNYSTQVQIQAELAFTLNWEVSWFAPANAIGLIDTTIPLVIEKPEETTEATTESTGEETGESTEQPSESASEPSEEPSEPASDPSEEHSSEPTEPSSQPTSEPTEPSSQPTEGNPPESTVEATTEPTEETTETTEATDPSDETTEPVTESTAATGETEETTEPDQPQE